MSGKYDVVIAGSGLGGLECAAILSKEGFNVCVLEKNELFGGCFQTYKRKNCLLDTGIHYIGSLDDGQIMNQYFRYFGIMDKLKVQRLDAKGFDQIWFEGERYNFGIGHSNFVEQLAVSFPDERHNLLKYVDLLEEVGSLISPDNLKKGIIAQNGMPFFSTSAALKIGEITNNPTLQNVLAGTALLYGGVKDVSTFYHHAMINNSYIESAYRFIDGSMQVTDSLIEVIKANGGTVYNRSEVTRFIVNDNTVEAVEVNGKDLIEGKNFISNIHPKRSLELIDKNSYIKKAYVSRVNSLSNSYGVFTLYLIMKENTTPYINANYYIHNSNNTWYHTNDKGINSCLLSFKSSDKNRQYTDVISILTPMYIDELKEWEQTTINNRGDAYEAFKQQYADKILDFIASHGLDYRSNIQAMYTTSPLSYRDYTGTSDGSAYGVMKDYHNPQVSFISPKTKLKNFYFTGQNMNIHGALGVTLTSMLTCAEFTGHEYLAKKVGNA